MWSKAKSSKEGSPSELSSAGAKQDDLRFPKPNSTHSSQPAKGYLILQWLITMTMKIIKLLEIRSIKMLQYRKRDVKTHFFPVQSRPAGRPGQIDGDDVDADVNADDVNADDDESLVPDGSNRWWVRCWALCRNPHHRWPHYVIL